MNHDKLRRPGGGFDAENDIDNEPPFA